MFNLYYSKNQFQTDNEAVATVANRLIKENEYFESFEQVLDEFLEEGFLIHNDLDEFDFSKMECQSYNKDKVIYILQCEQPDGSPFYYLGETTK